MSNLKRNAINNLLLTTSNVIFPLITFPFVTRTLSTKAIGGVVFVDAFTQYFIIFASLGIPFYGVREIAKLSQQPEERSKLVNNLVLIQCGLSLVAVLIFAVLSFLLPSLRAVQSLVWLGCVYIFFSSFAIEWFYQGIEKFSYITKRSLVIKTVCLFGILLLVKQKNGDIVYYALLTGIILLNAVINFFYYLKNFSQAKLSSFNIKPFLKPLLVLFSINVSISVYTILDTIILGLFTDTTSVSFYSMPLKLVKIVWSIVSGLSVVMIPKIAGLFASQNSSEVAVLLRKSLNVIFLITVPFCFLCIFYPGDILFIAFGPQYLKAVISLQILAVVPLIIGICNVFGTQYLLPIGAEKKILHGTILGLIVSITLNLTLIPVYGFVGSCIACMMAEFTVAAYIIIHASKKIKVSLDFSLLGLILFSTAIALVSGQFIKVHYHHLVLLALLGAIYVIAFLLLQYIVFKNEFVFSLLKIRRIINGRSGPLHSVQS